MISSIWLIHTEETLQDTISPFTRAGAAPWMKWNIVQIEMISSSLVTRFVLWLEIERSILLVVLSLMTPLDWMTHIDSIWKANQQYYKTTGNQPAAHLSTSLVLTFAALVVTTISLSVISL